MVDDDIILDIEDIAAPVRHRADEDVRPGAGAWLPCVGRPRDDPHPVAGPPGEQRFRAVPVVGMSEGEADSRTTPDKPDTGG